MSAEYVVKQMSWKTAELKDREFAGYAAAYGNIDLDGDVLVKGVFAQSIEEDFPRKRIKVLAFHRHPVGLPLEMREDKTGLWVKARISETAAGDELLTLMRDEVVDTMSVGFNIMPDGYSFDKEGHRLIKRGQLKEFSPVVFPANELAVIQQVKEHTPREIERVLREAGLSRSEAKAIVSGGVAGLRDAEESEAAELLSLVNKFRNVLEK